MKLSDLYKMFFLLKLITMQTYSGERLIKAKGLLFPRLPQYFTKMLEKLIK